MSSDNPSDPADRERLYEDRVRAERALEGERKARLESEALLGGLARLAAVSAADRVDAEVLSMLREVFAADAAAVLVFDGEEALSVATSTSPALVGARFVAGALFRRVAGGAPAAVFDVRAVPEWSDQPASVRADAASAIHLPLTTHGRRALAVVTHRSPAFFGPRHVDLARRFARIVVPLLEGLEAKRIESARIEAERRADALEGQRALLEDQLRMIREQQEEIGRLAAPVIQLWDELLFVPVVGALDGEQADVATSRILETMSRLRTREVIVDVTGVEEGDDQLAARLDAIIQCVRVMGGRARLSGVSPRLSLHLARLDVDITGLRTTPTLAAALQDALVELGYVIRRARR